MHLIELGTGDNKVYVMDYPDRLITREFTDAEKEILKNHSAEMKKLRDVTLVAIAPWPHGPLTEFNFRDRSQECQGIEPLYSELYQRIFKSNKDGSTDTKLLEGSTTP